MASSVVSLVDKDPIRATNVLYSRIVESHCTLDKGL